LFEVCSSTSGLGSSFLWELLNSKILGDLSSKRAKLLSKGFCQLLKGFKSVLCVEAKFCVSVPGCKEEEGVKDCFFMPLVLFWEKSFKNRNNTLKHSQWVVSK
jgi:hypothetical protein